MDGLVFRELVLNQSSAIDESIMLLIKDALGNDRSFSSFCDNIDYDSGNTRVLGGLIGDQVVCMNAFIRMKFTCEGKQVIGYQSGFSATSADHRGKGLWSKLMKFGEEFLNAQGGNFIFGYPNPVSHPLFVNKLGYRSMKLHDIVIAGTPFWAKLYIRHTKNENLKSSCVGTLKPDLRDNVDWKIREAGIKAVEAYNFGRSSAWGKIRTTTKLGFRINFVEIGGFELDSPADLEGLLNTALREARVLFCYISLNEENEYFPLFYARRKNYSPVIIKSLGNFEALGMKLNFFGGMRDTY